MIAVEVRQGTLGADGRSSGGKEKEEEEKEKGKKLFCLT